MRYRDQVTVTQDARASGSEVPAFTTTLMAGVPCHITETRGEETWRGRQLESKIDFVVEMPYSSTLATMTPRDRISVTGGFYNGKTLNVKWPRLIQQNKGRPAIIEVYCRENNSA